jgi:tripartite-type tricarboxylate transporter receptor subunit TctC
MKGLLAALGLALSFSVFAQYPNRPIKLVVPFPPGGPNDIIGRVIGQKMGEELAQPVILENRVGAGGTIGADSVAKSPPDGYTLLLGTTGTLAIAPGLYANLPYDPATSFAPVSRLTKSVLLVVANASLPADSLRELIALAKSKPGQLAYGGANGTPLHIAGEVFKQATGVDLLFVSYKGAAPAIVDLLAGRTHVMFEQLAALHPHIKSGKIRPLAVAAPTRLTHLPEVPTAAEAGLPDFDFSIWSGLLAPAATPTDVLSRLHFAVQKVLASREVRETFMNQGLEALGSTREEFGALIMTDGKKWAQAVTLSGAKLD